MLSSNIYHTRYFVLDTSNRILTYYKDDQPSTKERGIVNMNQIIDVQLSQVYDAPQFSLDLISDEHHYTIVADSVYSMVRWAFAFKLALEKATVISFNSMGNIPLLVPSTNPHLDANKDSQCKCYL